MIADIALVAFGTIFLISLGLAAYFWVMSRRGPSVPIDGAIAYREGFDLSDNPHPPHTFDHSIWRDDWLDADRHVMRRP